MSFRKYQSVENSKLLTKDEHRKVSKYLVKLGKASAVELTNAEREELERQLAQSD